MKVSYNITQNKFNASLNQETTEIKVSFKTGYYPLPVSLENYYTKQEVIDGFKPISYNPNIDEILTNGNTTANEITVGGLTTKYVQLDTTSANSYSLGKVYWNEQKGTYNFGLKNNVELQLGQEQHVYGKAYSAISNGQLVMYRTSQGGHILFEPANFTQLSSNPDLIIGVATQDIALNEFGYITTFGEVNTLNTSSFADGNTLYFGSGNILQNTIPSGSYFIVGRVNRSHATQGSIFVKPYFVDGNLESKSNKSDSYTASSSTTYASTKALVDGLATKLSKGTYTGTASDLVPYNGATQNVNIGAYYFESSQGFKKTGGTSNQALTADGSVFDLTTKADLIGGKVPSSQLPAYVDDVLEFANLASFPATGESGKIYIAIDTNITYRWTGTGYAEISASLALGETSSTAYRGDRGKISYDHSQTIGNPHGTTKGDIGLGNVPNIDATNPANITQSASYRFVTDIEKTNWNGKVSSQWTTSGSNIYYSGGNVGIGTIIPSTILAIKTTNTLREFDEIGYASYVETLNSARSESIFSSNYSRGHNFFTRNGGSGTYVNSFTINENGNVGIGTTSPQSRLHITSPTDTGYPTLGQQKGSFFLAGDNNLYGLMADINASNGAFWMQSMRNDVATSYNILLNPVGGNVGIGTTSPSEKLDVNGNVLVQGILKLKPQTSEPTGVEGAIYYNSTTKKHYGFDGTTWNALY